MVMSSEVVIQAGDAELSGTLAVPPQPIGLTMFVNGSGSSRWSTRNQRVAAALQARGLATLLFDLLTAREEAIDQIDPASASTSGC